MIETEFNAGDLKLAALENQGDGTVVIGLHGFLDNAESLSVLAPYLQSERFISLDLAGHGLSDHRPVGAQYNQFDYIQDLHALLEEQQWDEVILIGHSMGGIIASLYAGLFPEKVKGVVSIDACGPLTMPEDTTQAQMREAVINRHHKRRNKLNIVDLDEAVQARCRVSDIPPQYARTILIRNLTQDVDSNYFWSSDPRLRTKSMLRLTEGQAENIMRAIECPILIIGASNSFKHLDEVFQKRKGGLKMLNLSKLQAVIIFIWNKPMKLAR